MTTTTNNHTPGPWKTGDSDYKIIIGPHTRFRGKSLAGIALIDETDDNSEDLANARLIAAAPDLLRSLIYISARLQHGGRAAKSDCLTQCQWAIAKATGGADQ
jgi:hypothetical protein